MSLAFVPADDKALPARVSAGPWEHLRGLPNPEPSVPAWLRDRADGFTGTTAIVHTESSGEPELVVRSLRPVGKQPRPFGWVVAELPIDGDVMNRLFAETGVKVGGISVVPPNADTAATSRVSVPAGGSGAVGQTVSRFDAYDWESGNPLRTTVALSYKGGDLFERLSGAQSIEVPGGLTWADAIRSAFIVVAVLFLIIELAALVMGLTLARSITSSVHELFMGTERVRQGDFTHRINISTKDQLGELAGSFNQMTGSIENLLLTAAEKKRLQEELRIARQIQMSLLPRGPLDMDGLAITALCVPAREVGGDYYDFFPLDHDRLGVLIADVSGKGTSAALYMAELKGLVLSLSQIYQSPRQLLIEANRILSANLDSRSFITITYAMIDLKNRVMTYSRAGHTPLIYLPGNGAGGGRAQVLVPNGMVRRSAHRRRGRQVQRTAGRTADQPHDRRRHRLLHRRHHRGDEQCERPLRRRPARPDRRGARPPRVRRAARADPAGDRSVRRHCRSARRHDDDPDEGHRNRSHARGRLSVGCGPDFIIFNARIHTVDPSRPWAEALAVAGARLVDVGSTADILPLAALIDPGPRRRRPAGAARLQRRARALDSRRGRDRRRRSAAGA